jgi:hypothetical protein
VSDTSAVPIVGGNDRWIWIAALLLYGVGDTVTTFWGLSTGSVAEAGAVAGPLMESYGPYALLVIKLAVFSAFYFVWGLLRTPGRVAVPFALALVGGLVTAWNLLVIGSTL